MIMLLALPVIAAVALAHRYLLLYAPSNVLIRRVRASRPKLITVAEMMVVAAGLIVGMKVASDAVAAGAPGWLNLVVLLLAWDAIKVAALGVHVAFRTVGRWLREGRRRPLRLVVSRSARSRSKTSRAELSVLDDRLCSQTSTGTVWSAD